MPKSELYTPEVDAQLRAVYDDTLYLSGRDKWGRLRADGKEMAHFIGELAACLDPDTPGYGWIEDIFREDIVLHPNRLPMTRVQLWPRYVNYFLLETGGITEERAQTSMDFVHTLAHDDMARANLREISDGNIRTQLSDRSWPVKALAKARGITWPINLLVGGSGQGHAERKLLDGGMDGDFPFRRVDAGRPLPHEGLDTDYNVTTAINLLNLAEEVPIENVLSIDLLDPLHGVNTPEAEWSRKRDKTHFYTHEWWRDPRRIEEYDFREGQDFDNLHFLQADMTTLDEKRVRALVPGVKWYDMALLSFVGYQNGAAGMEMMLDSLRPLMKDENGKNSGMVVAIDRANRDSNGRLRFLDKVGPWTTGIFIYDFNDEAAGWYRVMRARDGRLAQVEMLPDVARLPKAQKYGLLGQLAIA